MERTITDESEFPMRTQAQQDALQGEINAKRFLSTLNYTVNEKKKLAIVEECTQRLLAAGIPAYIFADVNETDELSRKMFQYNTVTALIEYGKDKKPTPKSDKISRRIYYFMVQHLMDFALPMRLREKKSEEISLALHKCFAVFYEIWCYMYGLKIEPPPPKKEESPKK